MLHSQIFEICYHSQGGFTHSDVYNLPIYLRNFYHKKLIKAKEEEQEAMDRAQKGSRSSGKPNIPSFARNMPKK